MRPYKIKKDVWQKIYFTQIGFRNAQTLMVDRHYLARRAGGSYVYLPWFDFRRKSGFDAGQKLVAENCNWLYLHVLFKAAGDNGDVFSYSSTRLILEALSSTCKFYAMHKNKSQIYPTVFSLQW